MKYKPYIYAAIELLIILNGFLTARGINPIVISDAEIYAAVSYAIALIAFAHAVWKNHNFTEAARQAQDILGMMKAGSDVQISYIHGGEDPADVSAETHEEMDPED